MATPSRRSCSPTCAGSRLPCCEGHGALTAGSDLRDFIRQVEVFGFHFARLDIREHALVHRRALAEIYGALRVCEDYEELPEDVRLTLLQAQIADRRPLIPTDIDRFSEATRDTIRTFRTLRTTLADANRGAIQTYIISGSEGPADILEVLLLMKEASLCRAGGDMAAAPGGSAVRGRRDARRRAGDDGARCSRCRSTARPCGPSATSRRS